MEAAIAATAIKIAVLVQEAGLSLASGLLVILLCSLLLVNPFIKIV